ncbi:hypothetical protein FR943_20915 [Mycobacterium sp. TNTM28]|uniref:PE-PGRS family protein n=1 Tax=[Mycobacterium] fortunisiensis TaxID=2600579 RepID=A0ABS6KRV8_9MYCO|nr:hypothetical protein [[Mycobacterium] fortunisiensis]MBU9766295.1 hypothetical protein [[Mycobacterium] fortunisiensis]
MKIAARPYFTGSVALIGAGAIAMNPVAPPMPDVTVPAVHSYVTELTASVNPIDAYLQIVTNTLNNVGTLIGDELADPAPILRAIITNQLNTAQGLANGLGEAATSLVNQFNPGNPDGTPAQLQAALAQLAEGNIDGAVATAWSALLTPVLSAFPLILPAINVIKQPMQNMLTLLNDPLVLLTPALGIINVGYTTVTAAGHVGQELFDSLQAGDTARFVNALVTAPAVITDTFLNGDGSTGGVFGPSLGLFSTLRMAREAIATALTPTTTPDPEAVTATVTSSAPSARTVTLNVAPAETPDTTTASTDTADDAGAVAQEATDPDAVANADDDADAGKQVKSNVVTKSLVATPGETGDLAKAEKPKATTQVSTKIRATAKSADGVKKSGPDKTRSHRARHGR